MQIWLKSYILSQIFICKGKTTKKTSNVLVGSMLVLIVLKDGYVNAKNVPDYSDPLYTKLILENYNDNIHSRFVCSRWRRKLDRTVKGDVLIIIADFEPHTLDCNLCKSNVENKDLQIKTLDKIMMSHGYNNNCS